MLYQLSYAGAGVLNTNHIDILTPVKLKGGIIFTSRLFSMIRCAWNTDVQTIVVRIRVIPKEIMAIGCSNTASLWDFADPGSIASRRSRARGRRGVVRCEATTAFPTFQVSDPAVPTPRKARSPDPGRPIARPSASRSSLAMTSATQRAARYFPFKFG